MSKLPRNHVAKDMFNSGRFKSGTHKKHTIIDRFSWKKEATDEILAQETYHDMDLYEEYDWLDDWDGFHHSEQIIEKNIIYTVKMFKIAGSKDINYKEYYLNGKLHRECGPACEYLNGDVAGWYLNDEQIECKSQQEFERLLRLRVFW
jgi:hypothetical protein